MNLALILARGGSKRIPRKNILDFNGKPAIAYPISAAQKSELFDDVVVSTDDEEIAAIASHYGAHVPYLRDKSLADDHTTSVDVVLDYLAKDDSNYETVCVMYGTSVFVTNTHLNDAYESLSTGHGDSVISVTEFESSPQRALLIEKTGFVRFKEVQYKLKRTNDLALHYHDAAQFYIHKIRVLTKKKAIISEQSKPFIYPKHTVVDLDSKEDWALAELIHERIGVTTYM